MKAYKKVDGSDCAYVTASYFLRSTKAYNRANQEYVLRKDENGDWKILGFVALEGDNGDAEWVEARYCNSCNRKFLR